MKFKKWFKDMVVLINKLYTQLQSSDDVETLHQYRINLRKLYSLSEVYAKNINKKKSKKLSKIIKKIIKPTAYCRDLELFLIEIDKINCDSYMKEKLHTIFDPKQEKNINNFLHLLKSNEYERKLKKLIFTAKNNDSFIYNIQDINQYKIIKKTNKNIFKKFNKINLNTPPKEFHNLRKEFKKFRYALSIYEKFFKKNRKKFYKEFDLKEILDFFGEIQDNYIRLNFIKSVKKEFNKTQQKELNSHFEIKLQKAKQKLLNAKKKF